MLQMCVTDPELKPRPDISREQVARFIRRMSSVSEGEAKLVRALEKADDVEPIASSGYAHGMQRDFR